MPTKRAVSNLNRVSEAAYRAGIGDKIDQLLQLAAILFGGTSILSPPTLTNSTTALSYGAFIMTQDGLTMKMAAGTKALTATTHDVAATKWASYRVSAKLAITGTTTQTITLTITITKAADQNSKVEALATIPAVPANECDMGFLIIRGGDAAIFDATTDNLQSGFQTGGIVEFYPSVAPLSAIAQLV